MDFTAYYHIAFTPHRIMNPLTDEVLRNIGRHYLSAEHPRILDIGSGKGYVSLLFAREFGARTVQVDSSPIWTAEARRLFAEHDCSDRAEIHLMDADLFAVQPESYDMILALGTTPVFGGFEPALRRLRAGLKPDGAMVVGEISCEGILPKALRRHLYEHDWNVYQMKDLLSSIERAGMELQFAYRSTEREWDEYLSLQWKALADFVRARPGDEEAEGFLRYARQEQEMFLRFQRHYTDWNVFAMRRQPARSGIRPASAGLGIREVRDRMIMTEPCVCT